MNEFHKNQNGMTLVEILAAILILSIVLITFMAVFGQSAKFTAHNRETLTSVEVAENIIGKMRISEDLTGLGSLNKMEPVVSPISPEDALKYVGKLEVVDGGNSKYSVFITVGDSGVVGISTLKRIKVEVKPKNPTVKDSKPFETKIFLEVSS